MTRPPAAIDLRSDTVTKPSRAMRRAMADAEVGDDVLDGDPTTRRLEERIAELLLEANAHLVHYELARAARVIVETLR